jgi:hypothetical protein
MNTKKIYTDKQYAYNLDIEPAKKFIPEWYKKAESYVKDAPIYLQQNLTIKHCMPFLDAYTNGYMILLQGDLLVKKDENGEHELQWVRDPLVTVRSPESHQGLPMANNHSSQYFSWAITNVIKLPKNYSMLITHPLNRFDLPFTTLSGIVDEAASTGAISFFVNKDFEGIIPKGTPIAQILPFKQDNWEKIEQKGLYEELENEAKSFRTVISGGYKKLRWKRKNYN